MPDLGAADGASRLLRRGAHLVITARVRAKDRVRVRVGLGLRRGDRVRVLVRVRVTVLVLVLVPGLAGAADLDGRGGAPSLA